jgi:CDP-diacylglycerol--glycerol-3-phosphate 3-phosphatidyltransferase
VNISNSLSILRMLLAIPVGYLIYNEQIEAAFIIGTIAGITDFLDGFFARKLKQITNLGKILDPLADKIFVAVIAIVLLIQEIIPLWFFIVIFLRDLLILLGGLYAKRKLNVIMQSNFEGKLTFVIILAVIVGALLDYHYIFAWSYYFPKYGFYFATAAIIYSFGIYLKNFIQEIKKGVNIYN